jgi:hypothetical protein
MCRCVRTVLLLFCLSFAMAGCSQQHATGDAMNPIEGTWVTRSIRPPEFHSRFGLACISFHSDRTFDAVVRDGGQTRRVRGYYLHDAWANTLKLRFADEQEHAYRAVVWWMRELVLEQTERGGIVVRTTMERGDACPADRDGCEFCAQCPACQAKRRAAGQGFEIENP